MTGRTVALTVLAAFALLAAAWLTLVDHLTPNAALPDAQVSSVSGGGIVLRSDRIVLPAETATLPAGSEPIAEHCTACHSAEMILNQPATKADKWQATIDKMRGVYKAPIAPAEDKVLIAALLALPAQRTMP